MEHFDGCGEETYGPLLYCPLTKQMMYDPVTVETGHAFEREAILKWFRDCRDRGRKPTCPITGAELGSTNLTPSIALKNIIDEWRKRNEGRELDKARRTLTLPSSEQESLATLESFVQTCRKSGSMKDVVREAGIVPLIADMLKNSHRPVRLKALEVLHVLAEQNDDNKEAIAMGDTLRTIVKFLSSEQARERELAVSLLHELSIMDSVCEKIGGVFGAILILIGIASSKTDNTVTVRKADGILENLEQWETYVKQMADNGRLQPLLDRLLHGSPETQLSMTEFLGEIGLPNETKTTVAQQTGPLLIKIMKTGSLPAREATLKVFCEISNNDASARILLEDGILPPLIHNLFGSSGSGGGMHHFPLRLKEMAATTLANLVACGGVDFESIPLDDDNGRTLLSENVIHNLLHLISNTGPAIESKLLQVLVGLTSSPATVHDVVFAIKSSGAAISLIQFIEAAQREIRVASLKLFGNISPYMGQELADAVVSRPGHLSTLLKLISDSSGGTMEEQAAAVSLLADLPESNSLLTRQLFDIGAFQVLTSKLIEIRQGSVRTNRHFTPFLEGLVRITYRVTNVSENPIYIAFASKHNLAGLFTDMLQMNGLDRVQIVSAMALENLSRETVHLTRIPEPPPPRFCGFLFTKPLQRVAGLCRIHHGFCSLKETFCLLEGHAVEKLIACLDHLNVNVVEAALAALCTLLDDGVDTEEAVLVLLAAEGVRPILEILVEKRSDVLQDKAVWAVERFLRVDSIANVVAANQSVASALVEAYRNGDQRIKQIAERALRHLDRIPNFSSTYLAIS